MRRFSLILWALLIAGATTAAMGQYTTAPAASAPFDPFDDGEIHLVVRTDDIGFCHAINTAFERIAEEGVVTAVSKTWISRTSRRIGALCWKVMSG